MIVTVHLYFVMAGAGNSISEVAKDAAPEKLLMVSAAATVLILTPVNRINAYANIAGGRTIGRNVLPTMTANLGKFQRECFMIIDLEILTNTKRMISLFDNF